MRERNPITERNREIRDLFNQLSKKYKSAVVIGFITRNYFVRKTNIYNIISQVDNEPVDETSCSMAYKHVMNEGFNI